MIFTLIFLKTAIVARLMISFKKVITMLHCITESLSLKSFVGFKRLISVLSDKFKNDRDIFLKFEKWINQNQVRFCRCGGVNFDFDIYCEIANEFKVVLLSVKDPKEDYIRDQVELVALKSKEDKDRKEYRKIQRRRVRRLINNKDWKSKTLGNFAYDIYRMSEADQLKLDGVTIPEGAGYTLDQCKGSGALVKIVERYSN